MKEASLQKEKLEIEIKYLNGWLMEMDEEAKYAKRTAKDAVWKASKSSVIMSNRLQRSKDFNFLVGKLKEELSDEYHLQETLQIMNTIYLQIKRERIIGRRGGSIRWPVHTVMIICDLLVNRNPPSDIPDNTQTMSATLNGSEVNEIP